MADEAGTHPRLKARLVATGQEGTFSESGERISAAVEETPSDSRELLARSHVRCDSPWVTASIGSVSKRSPKPPPADRPPDSAAVAMGELLWEAPLRVRVSVNAPPGRLDAAVLVDAPDGESLRIPVLAYAR